MEIFNRTQLDTQRLVTMFLRSTHRWIAPMLKVSVRHSRGAIYSGTFASNPSRIYVNLGLKNHYPMKIETGIAKARSFGNSWWKPSYHVKVQNDYQVVLFVFLHEFYHYLIHRARRNAHRKEAMCDRFAIRYLMDNCGLTVYDANNNPVTSSAWLFQDLDAFVQTPKTYLLPIRAARRPKKKRHAVPRVSQK